MDNKKLRFEPKLDFGGILYLEDEKLVNVMFHHRAIFEKIVESYNNGLSPKKEYNGLPSDEDIDEMAIEYASDLGYGIDINTPKDLQSEYHAFCAGFNTGYKKSFQSSLSELEALKAEIAELKKENGLFKTVLYEVVNYSTSKTSALQLKKLAESVLKK